MKNLFLILLICLLFFPLLSSAQPEENDDDDLSFLDDAGLLNAGEEANQDNTPGEDDLISDRDSLNFRKYVIQFIIVTLIIIGSIIAFFLYVKKKNPNVFKGNIRIYETQSIGNGNTISLVHVGDEILVIGNSGNKVSLLTKITDPAIIEEIKKTGGSVPTGFKELLMLSSMEANKKEE
ncbi:MAG: FliO/MopB family protein [Candidatus Muiribacteriota bacterium]